METETRNKIFVLIGSAAVLILSGIAFDYYNKKGRDDYLKEMDARSSEAMSYERHRLDSLENVFASPLNKSAFKSYLPAEISNDELSSTINNQIIALSDGFQNNAFSGSIQNIIEGASLFYFFVELIERARTTRQPSVVALADQLEKLIIPIQKQQFPILRKRYASVIHSLLWEDDYEVFCKGESSDRIVFINDQFVRNRNIKSFHEDIVNNMKVLRFKAATYSWCKGCGNAQRLIIHSWDDGTLASSPTL